jgi:hypothetical protein
MQKLEEAKREARRRGDKKTQTSDARFDEKFQVGHGLSGEASKPWYAKTGSMLQPEEGTQLQVSSISNFSCVSASCQACWREKDVHAVNEQDYSWQVLQSYSPFSGPMGAPDVLCTYKSSPLQ